MEVHVVRHSNALLYADEIEQDHRHRHRIFVDGLGWEALRRPDGLDIDQYDNADAVRLLLIKSGEVAGGLRFTPLTRPNLTFDFFKDMVQRPLPDSPDRGADWTRFYVTQAPRRLGPSSSAATLYCAAMEYALGRDWSFLTFVSKPAMLEILLSIGWKVTPLGPPRMVDGDLAMAAWIEVSQEALLRARSVTGIGESLLADRSLLAPFEEPAWRPQVH